MENIFKLCVQFLLNLSEFLGTDYYTINVVIFCFVEPTVFILLVIYIVHLRKILRFNKATGMNIKSYHSGGTENPLYRSP